MQHFYLIALGGNRYHHRYGPPRAVLAKAISKLEKLGKLKAVSPIIDSPPMGHSRRRFANAALVLKSKLDPPALLKKLKKRERRFGRRRGRPWGERALDLDIILWSGGAFASEKLLIPHPHFRNREFVLGPAAEIAPAWRDPISGLTVRQLLARLKKSRAMA